MRFPLAWAEIASQNNVLKLVIGSLSLCVIMFLIAVVQLSLRDPVIIERACYSKALTPSDTKRSDLEIKNFIRLALEERFNSKSEDGTHLLSSEESQIRLIEQKKLSDRKIEQNIVINNIDLTKKPFEVDADRLLRVGSVRSALSFALKVNLETTDRSELNPYGLVLARVQAPKPDDKQGEE